MAKNWNDINTLIVLMHDAGKYNDKFQDYLNKKIKHAEN
jgi:hypothetical protein